MAVHINLVQNFIPNFQFSKQGEYLIFINWAMIVYYDFEGKRMNAEVSWPKGAGSIQVQLTDKRLAKDFPADLLFDISRLKRVTYMIENPDNKRLTNLQMVLGKRLQELTHGM